MSYPAAFPEPSASHLRALSCRGTFEAHLTVQAEGPEQCDAFRQLCDQLGVKCVLIELSRGLSRSQPMTASFHRGDLVSVLAEVEQLHRQLWQSGFPVIRVKLEAMVSNFGVPLTDEQAAELPQGYFEFHAKLRLPDDLDLEPLRHLCERHGAHLSRNNRKREGGVLERFVTLRVHQAGRERALMVWDDLFRALEQAGFHVINQQREYTLHDGRADLDAGWLNSSPEKEHS